jgi:hypothetical protein
VPEFDTCIGSREVPVGLGVGGISVVLPSSDFLDEVLFVGNPAVEALGWKHAEFGLRQIKPTTVLWKIAEKGLAKICHRPIPATYCSVYAIECWL